MKRKLTHALAPIIYLIWIILLSPPSMATPPIIIGMSAAFSGPSGHLGNALLKGIQPTIDHINSSGGVNGRPIKLIYLDDEYNPKKTVKNTIKLIKHYHADVLFSYTGTPTTTQIAPLLFKFNKPLFFPFTGAETLRSTPINQHVLHLRPSYWQEITAIIHHFLKNNQSKIAIYYQLDAFGQSGLIGAKKTLAEHHIMPVDIVNYPRGKTFNDNYALDAQILLRSSPDAIISISSYEASAGIIKRIRQTSQVPVATLSFSDPESLRQLLIPHPTSFQNIYYSQVVPPPHLIPNIEQYINITNQPYHPITYEGYRNTMQLSHILSTYSLPNIQNNISKIQHSLKNHHHVFLYQSSSQSWTLIQP